MNANIEEAKGERGKLTTKSFAGEKWKRGNGAKRDERGKTKDERENVITKKD
jgi:hypothetical protein